MEEKPGFYWSLMDSLLDQDPVDWIAFKENNARPDMIGEDLSALSNMARIAGLDHGYIVWGVRDNDHALVGTTFDPFACKKGNEDLIPWLRQMTSATIDFSFHGTAPSVAPSPLSLAISSSESVPGVYSDHISVPTIDNARYYLAESSASSPEFNYSGAQWFSGGDIAKTSGLGDALSPETSYRLYWRTHYEETCDSTVPKDSQQAYLYYEFTTLSALESAKRVALIQSYRDYGTSLAGLSSGATSDNLARMLVSLRSKIEAADTSGIATYSSDYLSKAYAFALAQDAAVASLRSGANLLVSDSDRSTLAFTEAVDAIASLDYFAGADISLASSLVDAALIQISGYRYSEALAQQLVAYFNDAILAKATGFNASDRAALWTLFDRGFKSVLNASGSDLATLKAQADAAFSQAKSDLAILLAQEKSAYVS